MFSPGFMSARLPVIRIVVFDCTMSRYPLIDVVHDLLHPYEAFVSKSNKFLVQREEANQLSSILFFMGSDLFGLFSST